MPKFRTERFIHRLVDLYHNYYLPRSIKYAERNAPFYRRKFRELGIGSSMVKRKTDLPKLNFFTTSKDLQKNPFDFLAIPQSKVLHLASTTGSTGAPKTVYFSKKDWNRSIQLLLYSFKLMGITRKDVAQIMFSSVNPTWITGKMLQNAFEKLGLFMIPAGTDLSPKEQVDTIGKFGSTILFSTPSYLHRVTAEINDQVNLSELGVKLICLGAEPLNEILDNYLEEAWNAPVRDVYGLTELAITVAGECDVKEGMHLVLDMIVEVIDPKTGEVLKDGEVGELVFTNLRRQATPLIRYRSGDLGSILPDQYCRCRKIPTRRISKVKGRIDDMVQIGTGYNLYPWFLDQAMVPIEGVSGYQMVITKNDYKDEIELRVESEFASTDLKQSILSGLFTHVPFLEFNVQKDHTISPPSITFIRPGTLSAESPIKIRKIVDKR